MSANAVKAWQGLLWFLGITLGVIPLIMYVVRGSAGNLWRLILDDPSSTIGWAGPLGVILAAAALIIVLDRGKSQAA